MSGGADVQEGVSIPGGSISTDVEGEGGVEAMFAVCVRKCVANMKCLDKNKVTLECIRVVVFPIRGTRKITNSTIYTKLTKGLQSGNLANTRISISTKFILGKLNHISIPLNLHKTTFTF